MAKTKVLDVGTKIWNGLAQALGVGIGGGLNPYGAGVQGNPFTAPVEKADGLYYNLRWYLVSNDRNMLSQAYVEIGLIQTICDLPVDDGLRGGVDIKSKQLDEEQIDELQLSLDRDNDIDTSGQACKWQRLYGGAGIIILTDQDPREPLDLELINADSALEFRACDMWELFYDKQNTEGYNPAVQSENFEYYDYYGEPLHKSRVMRLKGLTAPAFIRPRLRGWGFSVVEVLVRSINQYLKSSALTYEVLDEFKVDIYKIKNLVNTLLAPEGANAVRNRLQIGNMFKNYQNALVMDSEDDWDHKQLNFTGLAEAQGGIRSQVASDMRIPQAKLFGQGSTGFSSGEDDIENYNAMVESQVRNKLKYNILRICEIKCKKLFGFIPDDLSISFKPLRVMSSEQEETVKTAKFTRIMQARQAGELTTLEFRDACNKGNLFDIKLDTDGDTLNVLAEPGEVDDAASDSGTNPAKDNDNIDPGANRFDSKNPKPPKAEYGAAKDPKPPLVKNSPEFDLASYEADGGDDWTASGRKDFFSREKATDKLMWDVCVDEAKTLGRDWKMAVWLYEKLGGKYE